MTFDPAVAADLLSDLRGLSEILSFLRVQGRLLDAVEGCGDFASGRAIHDSLTALGQAASRALQQISEISTQVAQGIQQAAQRLLDQELANASDLERTHTERVTGARGTYNRTYVGESDRERLEHMIQSPLMAAAVPSQIAVLEQQARDLMTGFYNPGGATAATGMSYISDPHNPVASAPLLVPGMTPPPAPQGSKGASGPVPKALQTQSTAISPGSTNTGSSKSSGSSGSAQLTRAGNADAVAKEAAAKAAAQQAAAQQAAAAKAGAGNPASAAQSAASQAAQAGKGLSGLGQGGAATKSASALANAEKAAAERAAKAAAGLGKGGGGGGAGGGMGGAAAAEKALQARAGSMGAAEKMVAAEQAALQNGRAGSPGMNGAPMGGARPGGEGGEGKGHKAARYLNSKANGEEIVGDEQEVAPTVIGGLNLDTTDDRPVRGGGTPPRR